MLHGSEQSSDPADIIRYTKEWEFYGMFGLAALGKMIRQFLSVCYHRAKETSMKWEHVRVNGVWKLSKVLNYYLNWICIVLERIFLSN